MDQLAFWRDLSIIVLALEAFVFLVVVGVAFYYTIRGLNWLLVNGRLFFGRVQYWVMRAQRVTASASESIAGPVIQVRTLSPRVKATWRSLAGPGRDS